MKATWTKRYVGRPGYPEDTTRPIEFLPCLTYDPRCVADFKVTMERLFSETGVIQVRRGETVNFSSEDYQCVMNPARKLKSRKWKIRLK